MLARRRELPGSGADAFRRRGNSRRPAAETHPELRLTIRNDLGELARVNDLATELLERCGIARPAVYATQLVLEEALSNVIRHGYPDQDSHEIALVLRVVKGGIELQVEDDGREFDPTQAARL